MKEIHATFGDEEGAKILSKPVCARASSWGTDPLSRDACSFADITTGEDDDFELFEEPTGNALHFADKTHAAGLLATIHISSF